MLPIQKRRNNGEAQFSPAPKPLEPERLEMISEAAAVGTEFPGGAKDKSLKRSPGYALTPAYIIGKKKNNGIQPDRKCQRKPWSASEPVTIFQADCYRKPEYNPKNKSANSEFYYQVTKTTFDPDSIG